MDALLKKAFKQSPFLLTCFADRLTYSAKNEGRCVLEILHEKDQVGF